VKRADNAALLAEQRDLMPPIDDPSGGTGETYEAAAREKVIPLSPLEARAAFINRFYELTGTKPAQGGDIQIVNEATGGEKGMKPERFDLIPALPLLQLAEVYGRSVKPFGRYEVNNWRRGYSWSLSYAAMQRHANAFWSGQDKDVSGCYHLAHVAWHAFALLEFIRTHPELDDRVKGPIAQAA